MEEEAPPVPAAARPRWLYWRYRIFAGLVGLLVLLAAGLAWLDTAPGHRFVTARIAALSPASGLRIRVGRIEGSIYKSMVLHDVRLYDPRGLFFSSPRVELDWWLPAWLSNRLDIDRLAMRTAILHKWPKFNPSRKKGPLLPGFDIRVADMRLDRLTIAEAVAGRRQVARIVGQAEILSGRARLDVDARVIGGQDRILVRLDSRPDDDRFDLGADVNAPAGGLIGTLAGLKQDAALTLSGAGSWTRWDGRLSALLGGKSLAELKLRAARGRYGLDGTIAPQLLAGGLVRNLSRGGVTLRADGSFERRVLAGEMALKSAALHLDAKGGVDLGHNLFDDLRIDARLVRPAALIREARGADVAAKLRFDGPFDNARFQYLLTAPRLALGRTVLAGLRGQGEGRISGKGPTLIPVSLHVARMTGQGDVVDRMFANLALEGTLRLDGRMLRSDRMTLRAARLDSRLDLTTDLGTGRYELALSGAARNLAIPGLGIVDLGAELHARPDRNGAFSLDGRARAALRRFDNAFLRGLAGGLPRLETRLALGADGQLRLPALRLDAPLLHLSASGYRRKDGTLHIDATGTHLRYGPVRMALDGRIERPKVDLLFARPFDPARLADVRLGLVPDADGFAFTVAGGSALGPFDGEGAILLPRGGQAVIDVRRLTASGTVASGRILPVTGGLEGRLDLSGGGVAGYVALDPVNDVQRIRTELTARDADFTGPPPFHVARGQLSATVLLDPAGASVDATLQAGGVRRGTMRIGRVVASGHLTGGAGQAQIALSGQRGRLFDLRIGADIRPGRLALSLDGTLQRRPVGLDRPAVLTSREEGGWMLAPATIRFGGGTAQLAGEVGGPETRIEARLDRLPLGLLDIYNEDLGLGGVATGSLSYATPRGGLPSGKAQLRVRGLTRSGLAVSSQPVDAGINAVLTPDSAVARAVIVSGGRTIGRAQARLAPLGGGYVFDRLSRAPLFAQLRYDGPADTLWRMSNVETFDLSGPVAVALDARGTLADPVIAGSVAADDARFSSPVTGMALRGVRLRGSFNGSRLVLDTFSGTAKGGGTVTGSGSFDLSAAQGIGMDLRLQADNALLLDRDDIGASVTGPIAVRSNGSGGVISGDLQLIRSRFQLGRASAVAEIPQLRVIEVNRPAGEEEDAVRPSPWTLDIHANARNRLTVTGLGLNSEWRADLKIGGTITNPSILGTARLVRGSYEFAGRSFDLDKGEIRFTGNTPVNPNLDIEASANITDLSATIHVTGTGLQPEISFTSTPAMPEDELLSRLLFGSSITNLSAPEALQLASAVASLRGGGGGLDPINAVRKAAGLDRLRILPADSTKGQGTSIAAGKYITRRTYVELITDGQGYSATRVEFQITRWLSLLSTISTLGRQSANIRVSKDY